MSLVAGDLIDRAKLLAHPYGFLQQVSKTQLLAHLSNLDLDIAEQINQMMPSMLSTKGDQIVIVEAQNGLGYDLEPALGFTQFQYIKITDDDTVELDIVMEGDFTHPSASPSASIVSGFGDSWLLLPTDPLGESWEDPTKKRNFWKTGDKVKYRYIPHVRQMTKLTDELVVPDFAMNYLTQSLATLIYQMAPAPADFVQTSIVREQSYFRNLTMQIIKFARIHTPNHDFDFGGSSTVNEVLTR
jgi:hypothetical protein